MKLALKWIALILIFSFNIQITDFFREYGNSIESQMSWERFRIGLFSLIILIAIYLPKHHTLTLIFASFVVTDVVERLFFDTSNFEWVNLLVIFIVYLNDFKKFIHERQYRFN